ncbi:aminotransferase-like domain-containing protein [Vibrio salinus]|uniref:aminotransferase-like domain-containing protein n=1 Tax=Vibrio salinus TaxID=2899784 RepID=UPI001E34D7AF|nr:PLP-dependent aminotransferase family protein [Vibrio salinus]MCE0494774.1 PLP-dependent aminotransferase family protein [Vibrio salinus]
MNTIEAISTDQFQQACMQYPKYQALAWVIEQAIHEGKLVNKQKLPAQRLLADALGITHGTVTRAYALLEKKGIVTARLGAGTYVHLPGAASDGVKNRAGIKEYDFASSMQPMLGQPMLIKQALVDLSGDLSAIEDVMTYAYQGLDRHKRAFCSWFASKNINAELSDICFTNGAQQSIFTCMQLLTNRDDWILHEELTYPGVLHAAQACQVKTAGVPFAEGGLDLQMLEQYCQQYQPRLLYLTPNMQNPTNIRYSDDQLNHFVALSRKYQFYILEDDVNYCLPEDWRLPLQQRAPDRVFYLTSLSKYVAGGLRIACTLVPEQWQKTFNESIHSQCWMIPSLNFELASRFLGSDDFRQNQAYLAGEMRYRQQAFSSMAQRHGLITRSGGLNIWLTLPEDININQFQRLLITQGIKVRPADLFQPAHSAPPQEYGFRISLGGFHSRHDFDEGVAVFEQALMQLNQQQDVVI